MILLASASLCSKAECAENRDKLVSEITLLKTQFIQLVLYVQLNSLNCNFVTDMDSAFLAVK